MTDHTLMEQVRHALDWEASVNATDVSVTVDGGIVALRGNVPSLPQKLAAERTALSVYGIKAVANNLVVHLPTGSERTDTEIAPAAVDALKWNSVVPADRISVAVANGWITLSGTVSGNYERDAAGRTVRDLLGVKGVVNSIAVHTNVKMTDVRDKIEAAFRRSAELDARRISVVAEDGTVILSGNVHSWSERQEAERAAWAAPGVTRVDVRLSVVP